MSKNFKRDNAGAIVLFLRLGRDRDAKLAPSTSTHNSLGCECCGTTRKVPDKSMFSIDTTASGRDLHKIAKDLGLI